MLHPPKRKVREQPGRVVQVSRPVFYTAAFHLLWRFITHLKVLNTVTLGVTLGVTLQTAAADSNVTTFTSCTNYGT